MTTLRLQDDGTVPIDISLMVAAPASVRDVPFQVMEIEGWNSDTEEAVKANAGTTLKIELLTYQMEDIRQFAEDNSLLLEAYDEDNLGGVTLYDYR